MEPKWPGSASERYILDPKGDILLKLVRRAEAVEDNGSDAGTSTSSEGLFRGTPESESVKDNEALYSWRRVLADQDVHILVSSKHMRLASPVFDPMLRPGSLNGDKPLISLGCAELDFLYDDPDAFLAVMQIVHGRTRSVPRQVSLDMVKQVAIIVNKYQMMEVVEMFTDSWIHHLRIQGLPNDCTDEAIDWLFTSWVFQKPDIFKHITAVLIQDCDEKLDDHIEEILPIPDLIIKTIKRRRIDAIRSLGRIYAELIENYSTPPTNGSQFAEPHPFTFKTTFLGGLVRGCIVIGIWPMPKVPFKGFHFKTLVGQARAMHLADCCDGANARLSLPHQCHSALESVEASIKSLENDIQGLELKDFTKP